MEPFDIILDDNFTEGRSEKGMRTSRFAGGISIYLLHEDRYLTYHCCSSVKSTRADWYYFVNPNIDSDLISTWIDEISPIFPSLKIRLKYIPKDIAISYPYNYINNIIPIIIAEYSNKAYLIEAYLAHHLIRACFSNETLPYIKQYFLIKKHTPDLYFWNRIFLCQFGMRMYFYYWLTDRRFFNFVTEKDFKEVASKHGNTSSFDFFETFKATFPLAFRNNFKKWYSNYQFDLIISNLNSNKYVIPTPIMQKKSKNFDFFPRYKVEFEDEFYYYITGDNYLRKKYKKTNFNIIEE